MSEQDAAIAGNEASAGTPGLLIVTLWITGAVVIVLAVLYALATPYLLGVSSMCSDDFDTSDCASARAQALTPGVLGVVGVALWVVGVVRRVRYGAVAWAIGGLAMVLVPSFLLILEIAG